MVHHITNIIKEYRDELHEMSYVPKISYQRDSLGYCSDANKSFPTFLFSDQATGILFLKDVGLIRSKATTKTPQPAVRRGLPGWRRRIAGLT